ncbi:MAG: ParB/RepB/Spo0J family partition protein [Bdellovibrionaceae bacterium]|nr:ParB/RepB/Spo0J family partition protein [Pseudobdellovibrionaceae bacterium]
MSELSNENTKQKRGLGRGMASLLGGGQGADITAGPSSSPAPAATPKTPVPPPVAARPVTTTTEVATKVVAAANAAGPSSTPAAGATSTPASASVPVEGKVWQVGISKLKSGQFQPRKTFEKESLQELAQSIKENGILQPVIVRKTSAGHFEIVAGERRWRAAQLAGLHEVPVLIRSYGDKEALELAIIENVQREDLNPIEEAEAYSRLSTDFHLSQQQISERVGKDRATVSNAIRLLALPKEVKELVATGQLSVGHAKVLLSLPDPKRQSELAKKVISEKLAVRKLEKLVSAALTGPEDEDDALGSKTNTMNQLISALGDELQKMFGTKVQIDYENGRGKINIAFYSNEELNQIVDKLKRGCQA